MFNRHAAVLVFLCAPGCSTTDSGPPIVVTSNTATITSREKGYVACATALYRAYPISHRLRLRQAYQSGLVEDGAVRLFRLSGWLDDAGERRQVNFECRTEPSYQARILSLSRLRHARR